MDENLNEEQSFCNSSKTLSTKSLLMFVLLLTFPKMTILLQKEDRNKSATFCKNFEFLYCLHLFLVKSSQDHRNQSFPNNTEYFV